MNIDLFERQREAGQEASTHMPWLKPGSWSASLVSHVHLVGTQGRGPPAAAFAGAPRELAQEWGGQDLGDTAVVKAVGF